MGLNPLFTKISLVGDVNENGLKAIGTISTLKVMSLKRISNLYNVVVF